MRHTEEDRKAFWEDKKIAEQVKAREEKTAKWLADNPDVGVLNEFKYYRVINNEIVFVEKYSS